MDFPIAELWKITCNFSEKLLAKNILGFNGQKQEGELRAGVGYLLNKAFNKFGKYPYVIFVDLNMPPLTQDMIDRSLQVELQETVDSLCTSDNKDPFNLIIFTNHPHPYGDKKDPDPRGDTMMIFTKKPQIVPDYPNAILDIFYAAQQYGNIPNFFSK